MVTPPHDGVIGGHFTRFLGRWNYPQPRGTRPSNAKTQHAHGNTLYRDTVVKPPGLPSPCTMKCSEGLLTAFSLGFTPHIQCQACTDLSLRAYPVDVFLHLAIAPVAPLHRMRGGGQQLVIEKRESFVQRGGKEFLECLTQLGEPLEPTPQCGQCGQ